MTKMNIREALAEKVKDVNVVALIGMDVAFLNAMSSTYRYKGEGANFKLTIDLESMTAHFQDEFGIPNLPMNYSSHHNKCDLKLKSYFCIQARAKNLNFGEDLDIVFDHSYAKCVYGDATYVRETA